MKIISWNLNGIRSVLKKEKFYPFINEESPDIICLQETRALPSQVKFTSEFENEYPFRYWNNPEHKKGYSGTAIFSKIEPLTISYSPFDDQGRIICAKFEDYYIITVYVPNSGSRFEYRTMEWDNQFLEYLKNFEKKIIVCGDFNVISNKTLDIYNPKIKDTAGATLLEMKNFKMFLEYFVDAYRSKHPQEIKFSWWSNMYKARDKNNGWRIDYFLVSKDFDFEDSGILTHITGSDHAPCFLHF
jgi:exodeoxyribonuclease-3